jgi:hypothetical protein
MAEAMQRQGVQARVAEQDFQRAAGRRIALFDDRQVGLQCLEHGAILPEPVGV